MSMLLHAPTRENLADVRRGEFEGIRDEMKAGAANRDPDYGPSQVHADRRRRRDRRAAVSRRLQRLPRPGEQHRPSPKNVAKAVRGSSGGLRYVKGLGLEVDGQAQVSMNLVDTEKTPLYRAYEMVKMEAEARACRRRGARLSALVPERALFDTAARHIQLRDFKPEMVLEHKVRASRARRRVADRLRRVGRVERRRRPAAAAVAAHVGALGAALAQMVAGLTAGKKKYVAVDAEMRELGLTAAGLVTKLSSLAAKDAAAYGAVSAAYKLPSEPEEAGHKRQAAITDALIGAAEVPLETARACAEVADLAATCATKGNTNAVSDAGVAALLADAACRGAVYNVRINISSLSDRSRGAGLVAEANQLLSRTRAAVDKATAAVDAAIG